MFTRVKPQNQKTKGTRGKCARIKQKTKIKTRDSKTKKKKKKQTN